MEQVDAKWAVAWAETNPVETELDARLAGVIAAQFGARPQLRALLPRVGQNSEPGLVLAGHRIVSSWPERSTVIENVTNRVSVAVGMAQVSTVPLILVNGHEPLPFLRTMLDEGPSQRRGRVLISWSEDHLRDAIRCGWTVCLPRHPEDVAELLPAIIEADDDVVLCLGMVRLGPSPSAPAVFGTPRTIQRRKGVPVAMLLAAGAGVDQAVSLAETAGRQGRNVTVLETHTVTPGSGMDAAALADTVLVGASGATSSAQFHPVQLGPGAVERLVNVVDQVTRRRG